MKKRTNICLTKFYPHSWNTAKFLCFKVYCIWYFIFVDGTKMFLAIFWKFLTIMYNLYLFCIIIRAELKLQSRQLTVHNWLIEPCKTRGMSLRICLNFLIRWIARSKWICTDGIVWLCVTSSLVSCSLPCKNAGIFNETPNGFSKFYTVKPLSAINELNSSTDPFFLNTTPLYNFHIRNRSIL